LWQVSDKMGKYQRNKGKRVEYDLVYLLRNYGFQAERVPLSGSARAIKGDVQVFVPIFKVDIDTKSASDIMDMLELFYYLELTPIDYTTLSLELKARKHIGFIERTLKNTAISLFSPYFGEKTYYLLPLNSLLIMHMGKRYKDVLYATYWFYKRWHTYHEVNYTRFQGISICQFIKELKAYPINKVPHYLSKWLYQASEERAILIVKEDRKPFYAVMQGKNLKHPKNWQKIIKQIERLQFVKNNSRI